MEVEQFLNVLIGKPLFAGRIQDEVEDELLLELQTGHVVVHFAENVIDLGIYNDLLASYFFLGLNLVRCHPMAPM